MKALLVLLLFAVTACSSTGGTMDKEVGRETLLKRPTLEAAAAVLVQLRDGIRDRISADLGLDQWSDQDDTTEAGCSEFPGLGAGTAFPSSLLLTAGVPDEQWDAAVRLVTEVAGQQGFGAAETVVNRPRQHEVVLRGDDGALLRFSTRAHATLSLESGCHLPAAQHRSG